MKRRIQLTEFFIHRPVFFWSLMIGLLLAGVLAFLAMPKLEDPAVAGKQATVVVLYPGASALQVEQNVAPIIEDELRAMPDVRRVSSDCTEGLLTVTVEYEWTVLSEHLEQHFDILRRKMNDCKLRLPQECYDPIVIDDMMDVYGIFYSLSGEGYSIDELERAAKSIRRELLAVKGVKRINIVGGRDEVVNVTLSKEQLMHNGLLPTQLMLALNGQVKSVSAGSLTATDDRLSVAVSSQLSSEEDIADMIINTPDGRSLRLGDVASVSREFSSPQRNGFFVNGLPSIAICIAMESSAIVPDVGKAVDARLAEVMRSVPVGMQTEKIFFQPEKVDKAIGGFMVNLLESVAIVLLVLVFTMGFRSSLIIGTGLVLTIAMSFPILMLCGTTLQRISLGAFIVAMGMLVDNSIVVMDGILTDKRRGYGPKTYLFRICRNTAMPLLGATVIAASTFIGVFLSPDTAGEYAGDLFLVLCVSLLCSWFLAMTQVPFCAKAWLPARMMNSKVSSGSAVFDSPLHRFVRRTVSFLIGYKKTVIAVAVLLLVVAAASMSRVKNLFFPDFDYNQFVIEYFLPHQTSPDRVRQDLLSISSGLQVKPGIERVAASMGCAPAHYCLVRPMTNGGDCYGELIVDCSDYETVCDVIPALRDSLRHTYPDAYIRMRKYNFSISTSHTVEVQFSGPDADVLRRLSAQAEDVMRACPLVDAYSVQNNWKPVGNTLLARYRRTDAMRSNIERGDVANAISAATDGLPIGAFHDADKTVVVNLLVRNQDGSRIADVTDFPVWSSLNIHAPSSELSELLSPHSSAEAKSRMFNSVPLGSVADGVTLDHQELLIRRVNGMRTIEAECDPNTDLYDATPAAVEAAIHDAIDAIPLPPGYSRHWTGESETSGEAVGNIMRYVPLIMGIIIAILLLLFGNWRRSILILICFPFVFCGIVPALLIFRQPFTFMAIIGFMGLMGMMIKNSIVLVDEISRLITDEHKSPFDAVVEATTSRALPVVMASLTTILGMIPLLGDPMYGSMAITIMFGLAAGTVITLALLPVFYAAFFKVSRP